MLPFSKPSYYSPFFSVYPLHFTDLPTPFMEVVLVYANGVNPQLEAFQHINSLAEST
jgi:hypothetical protein